MAGGQGGESAALGYRDLLRTGPGTPAGRYLRSYWQPVARGDEIKPGEAKTVRVMSEDFTLFRGASGRAQLLADRCVHRGAKLGIGTVTGDALACAYHGWTFDKAGQCVAQPAEPRPFCDRARVRAFPTEEYLGLVFAYLGEATPPPLPRAVDFEDEENPHHIQSRLWPCNYFSQIENTFDVTHTNFLHPQFKYQTPHDISVEDTPYGLKLNPMGLSGINDTYDIHYLEMPNIQEFMSAPQTGESTGFYARNWCVPRDDGSFIGFGVRVYPLRGKEAETFNAKRAAQGPRMSDRQIPETAAAYLRGEKKLDGLKPEAGILWSDMVSIQDLTVMMSLEPMANRGHDETLGQMDLGIARLRRLWLSELAAFAEGAAPRRWQRPESLWAPADARRRRSRR